MVHFVAFKFVALRWVSALGIGCMAAAGPAFALDGNAPDGPDKLPPHAFASPREALDDGINDLQAGNMPASLQALNYAAEGGEPLALWKLGEIYEHGKGGVSQDDIKAYRYFDTLVRNFDEDKFDPHFAGAIANAFVVVAQYQLTGIAGTDVRVDTERALTLLQFAATEFKSTDAEFALGRLYLDGTATTTRDPVRAARWLSLAATKGHKGAAATFGHLLFAGEGVPAQRARGLKWEIVAKNAAQSPHDDWIRDIYSRDWASADEDDREMALAYLASDKLIDAAVQASKLHAPMLLAPVPPTPTPTSVSTQAGPAKGGAAVTTEVVSTKSTASAEVSAQANPPAK
jgi:TPR repeat protein